MSERQCDEAVNSGMVYAIRKEPPHNGSGTQINIVFKGCTFSCQWCQTPELQSLATELILHEERCVRCGACLAKCVQGAAYFDQKRNGENHPAVDRDICVVCGVCVNHCAGEVREIVGTCMTVDDALEKIAPDIALLQQPGSGVTFSGGEPLMQIRFLEGLLTACKGLGLHTTVDTSGYAPWEFFERIRSKIDLFIYDLKIMNEERHRQYTGLSNRIILENLKTLSELGHPIILHIPVIAGITDDTENLSAITRFSKSLPHLKGVTLTPLPYILNEEDETHSEPFSKIIQSFRNTSQVREILSQFQKEGILTSIVEVG